MTDDPVQTAAARRLTSEELADPDRRRRAEARLLDALELRRRHEQRRQGRPLALQHLGFRRLEGGLVIECRANLVEDAPFAVSDGGVTGGTSYSLDWTAAPPL
jgi:hypothetical protein